MDNLNYDAAVAARISEAIAAAPNETKNSVASKVLIAHSTFERKLAGGKGFTTGEVWRIARVLDIPPATLTPEWVA